MKKTLILTTLFCACAMMVRGGDLNVPGVNADGVRGKVAVTVTTNVVITNLSLTGTPIPDVTGCVYTQITDSVGYPRWHGTNQYYIRADYNGMDWSYLIDPNESGAPVSESWFLPGTSPIGTFSPSVGVTGNIDSAYSYVTNSVDMTNKTYLIRGR